MAGATRELLYGTETLLTWWREQVTARTCDQQVAASRPGLTWAYLRLHQAALCVAG